jgi:hypothetical protein
MQKFKVGDKVVRKEGMGKDKFFRDSIGGSIYYVVTSVSNGGYWLHHRKPRPLRPGISQALACICQCNTGT